MKLKEIPKKARIRVIWEDSPENYTQERQKRVVKYFMEKYENDNVQVIFKPKKVSVDGKEVEMSFTDNLMDTEYQKKLFKEWIDINKVDVDWDRFLKLDNKVNAKLSEEREIDYRYRDWFIREIEWSNFLSYGDDNHINFDELGGITNVTSEPPNMGGKTVLSLDLLLFLFFNTTTKGSTAIKMFNRFRDDKDEVKVKGRVTIDGVDYIIDRRLKRTKKRSGNEYTTRTDLIFQKVMPDGTIVDLEGEQRRETDELIKKSIGSVDDFLLTIMTDGDNLETIIKTKPTERGRIVSRFIGLEILEDKEKIVKEMKSKWSKNLKSDQFNIEELKTNIKNTKSENEDKTLEIHQTDIDLNGLENSLKSSKEKKEELISSKLEIDAEVINLRPEDIDREIDKIVEDGKKKKTKFEEAKSNFDSMEEVEYDEDAHNSLIKEKRELEDSEASIKYEIRDTNNDIKKVESLIKELEEGEYCPVCKKPLDDVDHTDEIKENKDKVKKLKKEVTTLEKKVDKLTKEIEDITTEISTHEETKTKQSEYDRTSIMVDKLELDLEKMRIELKDKKDLKKRYEDNLENIEKNKKLDSEILGYSAKIDNLDREKIEKIRYKDKLTNEIEANELQITKWEDTIEVIKAEEEIKIIFDIYIRAVGKNGISKMVMKKVMPLINSELDRLMSDTTDFKLFVDINEKQEVEFNIERSGIIYPITEGSGFEKTVSSLALRCVFAKVSCLPKPNIMVMDEVFGKVSNENLDEKISVFFGKVKEMFPNIFLITHNPLVKDWSDKIITVVKENHVSRIK
jgi:DNA repair exonuclease SbcCD ATPase subunit